MSFLIEILKAIFGIGLDKVVELADREDTVEDVTADLDSLDVDDSDLDGLDRFDGLLDEAGGGLPLAGGAAG